MTYHTVEQGEYLSQIASQYGFRSYETIWNHPSNAALKQKRDNPNVLLPGDRLFIPEKRDSPQGRPTDNKHQFQVTSTKLSLRLRLTNRFDNPIANRRCALEFNGERKVLSTTGEGQVETPIPQTTHQAHLTLDDPINGPLQQDLRVGDLDPVTEPSGQLARLVNMGYYLGEQDTVDDEQLRSAIEEFQCDHHQDYNLTVDGVCGPKTQNALKQVYGC